MRVTELERARSLGWATIIITNQNAIPQVWCTINREGVFYGQCSELCGVNHTFMPICVEAISPRLFLTEYVKKIISA